MFWLRIKKINIWYTLFTKGLGKYQINGSGIGLAEEYLSVKLLIFSFPSVSTYVLSAQKNCLIETVLLSTHNLCLG